MCHQKFFLVLAACCLLLIAGSANAKEIGLGISKSLFDISLLPGGKHSDSVTILNRSLELPLPVNIVLNHWDLKDGSEDIEFVTAEPALNATKWFLVSQPNIILSPGEERKINFSITPPKDISPGTYLITMRFQPVLPPSYFEKGGSKIVPEIAALFFLRVNNLSLDKTISLYDAGLVSMELVSLSDKRASIKNFIIPQVRAGVFEDAIKKMVILISNNGSYHFVANGYIEIRNWYGRQTAKIELPKKYLLPKRERSIEISILPEAPSLESVSLWRRILLSASYFLRASAYIGPYTATLILKNPIKLASDDTTYIESVPEDEILIAQAVTFWIIPWRFWGVLLTVILAFGFVVRRTKGRFTAVFRILRGKPL